MITSKPLPGEPNWEELMTAYRLYRLLRSVVAKELEQEKLTPEEQKLAELEEYNPYFSRHEWRAVWKGEMHAN